MADRKSALPTTTDAGIAVQSDEHSLTVGSDGPIVLHDHYLIEQMANFNRERIAERQPHAKGSGAFGYFETTKDVSKYTKAKVFQPGAKVDVAMRFSTVAGERGSPDTWRDPRGFSVKFYTEDGNFDMVGNNTPIFFIRDPLKFQHFIRSQKRRADNGLRDHDMMWDFWTLSPESTHQVAYLMGDRGVPKNWREMNGYSSHTYMLINEDGEKFWVKFHFHTDVGDESGNAHFTQDEAVEMAGKDSDYHRRDLFNAIHEGNPPSWTLKWQIMPYEDAKTYRINPFDLTKTWPHEDYPLIEVGKLVLDKNPVDWDTQIEQLAFEPNNMVPGIGLSPDKMLLARGFAYADAHRARLGVNYKQIPVNKPQCPVHSYSRAGHMRTENAVDPVYAPNSYGGATAYPDTGGEAGLWHADGDMVRRAYELREDDDDVSQARALILEVFDDDARDRFVSNVSGHLADGVSEPVLQRAIAYWRAVDDGIADRIEKKVRDMIGGKSKAPGMASAESISGPSRLREAAE
ncbi:catalase [Aurantiacibacter zhengii]|uniref:catalase n=1 Tax=Aurantiacibacter zhengii TaxID=2307003 RepID=A0A418NQW6_9SPHN|nr:catalase [Aurantiacibacter zhengii]RIV85140.1 catalase [Aurantiacibacter zhengii]